MILIWWRIPKDWINSCHCDLIHNQMCDLVHETSGHVLQAAGNRIDIVYDSPLAPRGSAAAGWPY